MAEQFKSTAAAAQRAAGDNGKELHERAKDQAQSAYDAGRRAVETVAEQGKRQVESVSSLIRDWPLLSVAVAFAAGCVVSRLMHGR